MEILVISASLNPDSNSRVLAHSVETALQALNAQTTFLDLRDYPLPLCDGEAAYEDPAVDTLSGLIKRADAILVAAPIYNYDLNAAIKNLVELTGSAWEDKIVGFLCAAGGRSSYMSVMGFANSLMFDFRCLILPRFIYAVGGDFGSTAPGESQVQNPEIIQRIQQLAAQTVKLAAALR